MADASAWPPLHMTSEGGFWRQRNRRELWAQHVDVRPTMAHVTKSSPPPPPRQSIYHEMYANHLPAPAAAAPSLMRARSSLYGPPRRDPSAFEPLGQASRVAAARGHWGTGKVGGLARPTVRDAEPRRMPLAGRRQTCGVGRSHDLPKERIGLDLATGNWWSPAIVDAAARPAASPRTLRAAYGEPAAADASPLRPVATVAAAPEPTAAAAPPPAPAPKPPRRALAPSSSLPSMAARFEQLRSMHETSVAAREAERLAKRDALKAAQHRKPSAAKPVGFGPAVRITASGAVLERGTGRLIQGPRAPAAAPSPSEARPSPPRLFVHQGAANVVGKGPVRALTAAASAPGNFLVGGGVA